nr:CinA family protein [Desulfobacterales bacterium]
MKEKRNSIEEEVGQLLTSLKITIAVAESCSGGLICHRLTSVSGSSRYFERGIITYSNRSKVEMLGVPEDIIDKHGAVSRETAVAMAEGVRRLASTDLGLSVTGIAGPTGGSPEKPVGTVFMALSSKEKTVWKKYLFEGDRASVTWKTSEMALVQIREYCIMRQKRRS